MMTPDILPYHPNPSRPRFCLPANAVDAHCHVFGPAASFPYAPSRKYTPHDAPKDKLFALRDLLGFSRNVIVQASCHGTDNAALVDALHSAGDLARGVAVVSPDIQDQDLDQLHDAGVRAIRFNFVKRLVSTTPQDICLELAKRVARLGWHVVVYFEVADLKDLTAFMTNLPTTVVIDHMGRPDIAAGTEHEDFQLLVDLLAANEHIWTKVSCPERLSLTGPDYDDVVPFAKLLVERFPDRVLWGTDWPHPNMKSHIPDDGKLVDVIPKIASTDAIQKVLLVDNPHRLYWADRYS